MSDSGRQQIQHYLNYSLLSEFVGYLLKLVESPGEIYLQSLEPIKVALGDEFAPMLQQSVGLIQPLAKKLRFSLKLVKYTTKHLQKSRSGDDLSADINTLGQRLQDISSTLKQHYPESNGELPPVLIAYVASFFIPNQQQDTLSCNNPLPEDFHSPILELIYSNNYDSSM